MANLKVSEIKSFVPAKDFDLSKRFYQSIGFEVMSEFTDVFIGDNVMIAPNVTIATGTHPISPELRLKAAQFNVPVRIGNNVWLDAHTVVLPGVTIGENSVIGAGSIVTKDIPANVVAVGNPCRVVREINERDREYYHKDRRIPDELK